jgi:hydroxymethylpyrimidine/phosphomethylpyrimidine kinase
VLTIAGFDPSSGAGVTADVKTIAAHGCYGVACITALTVQSTKGVRRVQAVEARLLTRTLRELAADLPIAAIHIGMLANGEVARAVVRFLRKTKAKNIVLDPIMNATSGAKLIDSAGLRVLKKELLPLATLVTPNLGEAATLSGMSVKSIQEMKAAAGKLHKLGATGVVITGGHLPQPVDLLSVVKGRQTEQKLFRAPRRGSRSTHGTGCAFSTALACQLARGEGAVRAVQLAKEYVGRAIATAYPIGQGHGPLHHLYQMNRGTSK